MQASSARRTKRAYGVEMLQRWSTYARESIPGHATQATEVGPADCPQLGAEGTGLEPTTKGLQTQTF